MRHISILFHETQSDLSTISCIAGAFEVFHAANACYKRAGKKALFEIQVVGTSKPVVMAGGLFTVAPGAHIDDVTRTDLIIIPSFARRKNISEAGTSEMIEWIKDRYRAGAEVASICSGAFLLAATGLLEKQKCSTHWAHADAFRAAFPKVNLQPDQLITYENGIYTNGGAYSFLNLLIYLVERFYDRPTAIHCSKMFQIEMDRNSQSSFAVFTGQKRHGDDVVLQAQAYIESRLDEKISVEELSTRLCVGRRNFDRRFLKATGNTPAEYAQRVKIESARKKLEVSRKTINEIMYEAGYSDVKAFREAFRKTTGLSPLDYRKRYNKEAAMLS